MKPNQLTLKNIRDGSRRITSDRQQKTGPHTDSAGVMRDKGGKKDMGCLDMGLGVEALGDLDEQRGPADMGRGQKPPGLAEAKPSV